MSNIMKRLYKHSNYSIPGLFFTIHHSHKLNIMFGINFYISMYLPFQFEYKVLYEIFLEQVEDDNTQLCLPMILIIVSDFLYLHDPKGNLVMQ